MKITSVSLISMLILGLFLITAGCTQSQPEVAASTPQVTDIVGVWTGTTTGYTTTAGFRESNTTYTITAQKGPAFFGSKVYTRWDNNEYSENLSGVISTAGEIFIVENDDGYTFGEFINQNEIELRHLQDGNNSMAFIVRLNREEN
ncbi:hypothetical protein F1737_00040 [Methanoplanus sp. FWC-SCC4]|uniref:Uncharacterized protein n=1 Tax=Methanochimaera problematica TaxID=2609417 RepID=A0AA97F957_9EURY|nr:hypothetical protein [Methanoplanus sp. FWC-SCC4]WOF15175.1 hypothetical protein F1737_00040 [Methanoplanus sp. FWC-SCC4]